MGADDADDKGMEVFHQIPRSNLIALPDTIKTASQIKRLVVRHITIDASSLIFCKTLVEGSRLRPAARAYLDFSPRQTVNPAEMAFAFQALRLTRAHDL
jgi:hypothetical protein